MSARVNTCQRKRESRRRNERDETATVKLSSARKNWRDRTRSPTFDCRQSKRFPRRRSPRISASSFSRVVRRGKREIEGDKRASHHSAEMVVVKARFTRCLRARARWQMAVFVSERMCESLAEMLRRRGYCRLGV